MFLVPVSYVWSVQLKHKFLATNSGTNYLDIEFGSCAMRLCILGRYGAIQKMQNVWWFVKEMRDKARLKLMVKIKYENEVSDRVTNKDRFRAWNPSGPSWVLSP